MSRLGIATFVLVTALVTLGPVSIAIADPGGWAAWRVALAVWPLAVFCGFVMAAVAEAGS